MSTYNGTMRPELRGIEANDIPGWPDWSPSEPLDELQWFTVAIGLPGRAGVDNFQVAVATPAALRLLSGESKFVGLMVERFQPELVERTIREFVESCEPSTWEAIVDILRTRMNWEFEGYRA